MLCIVTLYSKIQLQSYKLQLQELKLGILPADTNIDRIYNGNLAATVAGVNYLQGPKLD
jgi:hypothetical protein